MIYRKTSIWAPGRSIFQPFLYKGVLLEVALNSRVALYFWPASQNFGRINLTNEKKKHVCDAWLMHGMLLQKIESTGGYNVFWNSNGLLLPIYPSFCAGIDIPVNYY